MREAMAARLGLGETDLLAMDHIAREPSRLGPVELSRRLGITSASATVLVDRLEAAGHLHRIRPQHDGRRIALEPTASALADIRAAVRPMVEAVDLMTADLDPEQASIVLEFLTRATTLLREYARHADEVVKD
jgi:DNA-binding MarR family transcriptional regulator